MALRRFKPALADCQAAQTLQADSPSAKTLTRLARCHLALGNPALARSTLDAALKAEPGNAAAQQGLGKIAVCPFVLFVSYSC